MAMIDSESIIRTTMEQNVSQTIKLISNANLEELNRIYYVLANRDYSPCEDEGFCDGHCDNCRYDDISSNDIDDICGDFRRRVLIEIHTRINRGHSIRKQILDINLENLLFVIINKGIVPAMEMICSANSEELESVYISLLRRSNFEPCNCDPFGDGGKILCQEDCDTCLCQGFDTEDLYSDLRERIITQIHITKTN